MSKVLRFFGRKPAKEEPKPEEAPDPEAEKRKLKKQLSISRSGRFKQKNRQRTALTDNPGLFDQETQGSSDQPEQATGPSISPNNSCRDVNGRVVPGGMRLNGQLAS